MVFAVIALQEHLDRNGNGIASRQFGSVLRNKDQPAVVGGTLAPLDKRLGIGIREIYFVAGKIDLAGCVALDLPSVEEHALGGGRSRACHHSSGIRYRVVR